MKFLIKALVVSCLVLALSFLVPTHKAEFNPITPQRKATHMITYVRQNEETGSTREVGVCTGTAVGPHALLTAIHCDEGEIGTIRLDLSQRLYHIIGTVNDGRDHIIYHLDGPAFTNVVDIHERVGVLGEKVISYGNGQEDYPQHTYVGKVIVDDNGGDTSDVDAIDGTQCFSLPVVPGDSGSAIYGKDGSILALVTYGNDEKKVAVGFALAFPPDALKEIKE